VPGLTAAPLCALLLPDLPSEVLPCPALPCPDEDPLAAVSKGVSLRGLRRLARHIAAWFGPERYVHATTTDVTSQWVVGVSVPHKCRVAEMRSLLPEEVRGVAWRVGVGGSGSTTGTHRTQAHCLSS
jgi:hypothetical protein